MARVSERWGGAGGATGLIGLAAAAVVAGVPGTAEAACSVFDRHPCAPTVCSVFRRGPCVPEIEYPLGQDLRLTIETTSPEGNLPRQGSDRTGTDRPDGAEHDSDGARRLDSIRALFAALRACWVPPAQDEARPGMQMSVRFAFKRSGEIIGTPRVTYVSPDTPNAVRERYHDAITQALARCTPMPFTRGMGGAVAGRPIAIRFVDNRSAP